MLNRVGRLLFTELFRFASDETVPIVATVNAKNLIVVESLLRHGFKITATKPAVICYRPKDEGKSDVHEMVWTVVTLHQ